MVFAGIRLSVDDILQGNAVKVIQDDMVQAFVDGKGGTDVTVFTQVWGVVHTAYRGKASLCALQNFPDCDL